MPNMDSVVGRLGTWNGPDSLSQKCMKVLCDQATRTRLEVAFNLLLH